jgi:hypothetical protein
MHPTSDRPDSRKWKPRRPISFGDRHQSPLHIGRAVCARFTESRPHPDQAEHATSMRASKSPRAVGLPVSSSTPGERRCRHWHHALRLRVRAPEVARPLPTSKVQRRRHSLSTLSVGYTTDVDGHPPASAACQRERHTTPSIHCRERPTWQGSVGPHSATSPPRSRSSPTLPSRRPEYLETQRNHDWPCAAWMQNTRDLHRGDPRRSPRRPLSEHVLRRIHQTSLRVLGATSVSPRSRAFQSAPQRASETRRGKHPIRTSRSSPKPTAKPRRTTSA